MIDLKGKNKAEVLAALYNASRPQGLGFLSFDAAFMTKKEARALLDSGRTYFDYLKGRVLKVDLSGDELDPRLYDRDNGQGAAAAALGWPEERAIERQRRAEARTSLVAAYTSLGGFRGMDTEETPC